MKDALKFVLGVEPKVFGYVTLVSDDNEIFNFE